MQRFKDKEDINRKTAERDNLRIIASKYREAVDSDDFARELKNFLLGSAMPEPNQQHHEKHFLCQGCSTDKHTEKRICRCMYYYGKNNNNCNACSLIVKWKNVGSIQVTEYEMPTKYVQAGVGGMDLILDGSYAAEVKPPYSHETISRMIAETLTYTIDTIYKPAIAFFEGSDQEKQYNILRNENNGDLEFLLKYITAFKISYSEKNGIAEYSIHRLEESTK